MVAGDAEDAGVVTRLVAAREALTVALLLSVLVIKIHLIVTLQVQIVLHQLKVVATDTLARLLAQQLLLVDRVRLQTHLL